MAISYVLVTLKEIGIQSWVAFSGLEEENDSLLMVDMLHVMGDSAIIPPVAPTDDKLGAIVRLERHVELAERMTKLRLSVNNTSRVKMNTLRWPRNTTRMGSRVVARRGA